MNVMERFESTHSIVNNDDPLVTNHSFEMVTQITTNNEDPDRILKEQVCSSFGLSLQDFLSLQNSIPTGGYNDSINENVDYSASNDSFNQPTINPSESGIFDLHELLSPHEANINSSICGRSWDGILCWTETQVGNTATLPCLKELNGIMYDSSQNATRYCDYGSDGGVWNTTNYDLCFPITPSPATTDEDSNILALSTTVYFFGYCLSLITVTIAMIIFFAYKELRCLRNTIHTHLIITYILADTTWIITNHFSSTTSASGNQDSQVQQGSGTASCISYIILHYFHLTNFFWMFVEGLYLYVLVVQTFVAENIKLRVYVGIGWGIPFVVVISWAVAKWLTPPAVVDTPEHELDEALKCVVLVLNNYDWIYKGPVIFTLAANSLFLLQIMVVLITKLRSATNPETQQSMKAAKALVVLMPLLGITYLLMLAGSREPIYEGFLVALLYCFLNGEVRKALRHRWNTLRTMGLSCCNFGSRRRMHNMRSWSPHSRTESIRLYTPASHPFRKRGSSTSEVTTMTSVHSGTVNGIMQQKRLSTTFPQTFYPHSVNTLKEEDSINSFI